MSRLVGSIDACGGVDQLEFPSIEAYSKCPGRRGRPRRAEGWRVPFNWRAASLAQLPGIGDRLLGGEGLLRGGADPRASLEKIIDVDDGSLAATGPARP
jgi:hypothetical protein